jgi:hypothetical protein
MKAVDIATRGKTIAISSIVKELKKHFATKYYALRDGD